jgi:hypothetical protein
MGRVWPAAAWVSRSQPAPGGPAPLARHRAAREGPPGRVDQRQPGPGVGVDAVGLGGPRQHPTQIMALAELTRYTLWPWPVKNTAIGSHTGPVGSTTTSSRGPGTVPARAACSTSPGWPGRTALRRHTTLPSPESTRRVWALGIPRSIPTSPRSASRPPCGRGPQRWRSNGGACLRPRSQGGDIRRRRPRLCCNRPRPARVGPLPASGTAVPATDGHQSNKARHPGAFLTAGLNATPEPAGMRMQPWNHNADQAPQIPYMRRQRHRTHRQAAPRQVV